MKVSVPAKEFGDYKVRLMKDADDQAVLKFIIRDRARAEDLKAS